MFAETALWREALAMPEVLRRTLRDPEGGGVAGVHGGTGVSDIAAMLAGRATRRVVVTGNGAAYYVAHALWLASLERPVDGLEMVALPAGVLAAGGWSWQQGDLLLAISTSGEQRDVVELLDRSRPERVVAITASPSSTIGTAADLCALVEVASQQALTHTQAFVGNLAAAYAVWAEVSGDAALRDAVSALPSLCAQALDGALDWAAGALSAVDVTSPPSAAIAFGTGLGWVAAMETALLVKEIAGIPTEGMETREGATSGMYALRPGHLVLSLPAGPDPLVEEAEATCAGTGATVVRVPGGRLGDRRLAPVTTFPAALALAGLLGHRAGLDVDAPGWSAAYYATARVAAE